MTSPTEDLESAAEFGGVRQNVRSTVISTDAQPATNILDTQATFQDIQYELQEFILKHLSRTVALQRTISSHHHQHQSHLDLPGLKVAASTSGGGEVHGTVTPNTYPSFHPSDGDPNIIVDAVSDQAICNQGVMPSRRASANPVKAPPLENHLQSLSGFLNVHVENLHALQNSLRSTTGGDKKPVTTVIQKPPAASSDGNEKFYDALTQQFNMLVVISTFTAGLIVGFLALVDALILPNHRTAFNVGMLFSFFALSLHFGNIIVAGRGAAISTQHLIVGNKDYTPEYFRYYLSVCEQLQFAATLLFIVSIVILSFYIFGTSLAFPLVLMFVAVVGTLVVFWSAYWKVSITFRNLKFIVQNFRRLRWRSLAYLQARGGVTTTTTSREGQHA
ncbi:hypothetical protein BYT27DRAFT_7179631 [Phlegmacium glaucopus]|nr:hypothetical protein BYT27DRAFT_7179631 [Phlegmacium glaucopus]